MSKAVILLSGGLDSTTVLAIARSRGYECYALSFDYGQKQKSELNAAIEIAKSYQVKEHRTMKVSLSDIGGSALTDKSIMFQIIRNLQIFQLLMFLQGTRYSYL